MMDEERDALLLEIRDTQRDHGERLERIEGRQATQSGQLGALARDVDALTTERVARIDGRT